MAELELAREAIPTVVREKHISVPKVTFADDYSSEIRPFTASTQVSANRLSNNRRQLKLQNRHIWISWVN